MTKNKFITDILTQVKQELENRECSKCEIKPDVHKDKNNIYYGIVNNNYLFSIVFCKSQDDWIAYFSNSVDPPRKGVGIAIGTYEHNTYFFNDPKMIYTMISQKEEPKQIYGDLSYPIKIVLDVMLK